LAYTRPELHFRVEKCKNEEKLKSLKKLINDFDKKRHILMIDGDKTKCGLIFTVYAGGKFGCLGVSEDLSKCYPGAVNWYAGGKPKKSTLSRDDFDDYKKRVQTDFKDNKFPLLAATKAFGLGIDKPNIRFTIHYGIPGSLEALYQEAGRAGRDKKDAGCYILYSTEHMEREKYNKLFELNTTMEEIIDIVKSTPIENTSDVLRNFYLWTQNNKGVDYETHITSFLFNEFAKPGEVNIINCGKLNETINEQDKMSIVQKAIYRLSLLEIVDDWTIEKFGNNGILEVTFNNFDEETVKRAFLTYINKYDIEFDLKEKYRSDKYKKYYEIIDNIDLDYYERFIRALIQWNYDNVIYHRRQSLKTLVDLCENYSIENEENFKKQIESYFIFTENTFVFDYLAENPLDYVKWFELFLKNGKDELKSIEEFYDMNSSLKRFLESYRYNTALNYMSGMLKLFLGQFDDINGRDRLLEALKDIDTLAEQDKKVIFKTTLKLGTFMSSASKVNLGEVLCEIWNEKAADIYKVLEDNASLYYVIDNSVKKLKNIGGSLLR
jgi:ATP-dependent DNA helicase RecQ